MELEEPAASNTQGLFVFDRPTRLTPLQSQLAEGRKLILTLGTPDKMQTGATISDIIGSS
jgi:hypothetical protein